MKRILLFAFVSTVAFAMEPQVSTIEPHECCPTLFGMLKKEERQPTRAEVVQWVMRIIRHEPDTFTQFLCSKEQTADFNDVPAISIHKDLLKRMLVHNYYANKASHADVLHILTKALRKISDDAEYVVVSKKDWYHRLLPHIPWNGQRDHWVCYPLLIKDRVVFLKMDQRSCIHTQTGIRICPDHTASATPVTDVQLAIEFNAISSLAKVE